MNDREFDKQFSERLTQDFQHPYDDHQWALLSDRLDIHDKDKSVGGGATKSGSNLRYLYWLAPLLLLLLGTNAWFMWNANNTQHANDKLISEIHSLKTLLEKRDTVIQTKIIYKTDTIYIDRKSFGANAAQKIDTQINNTSSSSTKATTSGLSLSESIGYKGLVKNVNTSNQTPLISDKVSKNEALDLNKASKSDPLSLPLSKTGIDAKKVQNIGNQLLISNENKYSSEKSSPIPAELGKNISDESITVDKNNLTLLEKLPLLPTPKVFMPFVLNNKIDTKEFLAMPIIKPANSSRLYFGLSGSWLNYNTAWLNNAGTEVFKTEQSYQLGMRIEYAFNDNWRLMMGSDYCPFVFDIAWKDPRYHLPELPSELVATHKFKSVSAREPLLNGFLGAKYIFKGIRARPYIGLAYSAMKILPYEAKYKLQSLITWSETERTVQHNGETISNLMMLTGGYEFKLGGRWVGQTEAYIYKDLNKEKKMFDLFGVRATVLTHF
jgi:hypothetical protein